MINTNGPSTLVERLLFWEGEYNYPSGLLRDAAIRIGDLEREVSILKASLKATSATVAKLADDRELLIQACEDEGCSAGVVQPPGANCAICSALDKVEASK